MSNPFISQADKNGGTDASFRPSPFNINLGDDRFQAGNSGDQVRKGKWTTEEERYANKVIEYFNAGTLRLDENDRGITLRAYLSQKLGCDPMRITKKYTGAACLGKRVYHAFRQNGRTEDVERAERELDALENDFKAKLSQMGRRKTNNEGYASGPATISTPGIEALFKNHQYSEQWTSTSGAPVYSYGLSPFHPSYAANLAPRSVPVVDTDGGHRVPDNSPAVTPTAASGNAEGKLPGAGNGSSYLGASLHHALSAPTLGAGSVPLTTSSLSSQAAHRDWPGNYDEAAGKRMRVGEHEAHVTEAASSLLGFFTQLERNSSQEDMLHFFEGVQKTAAATVASSRSPPKPTMSSFMGSSAGGSTSNNNGHHGGASMHGGDAMPAYFLPSATSTPPENP